MVVNCIYVWASLYLTSTIIENDWSGTTQIFENEHPAGSHQFASGVRGASSCIHLSQGKFKMSPPPRAATGPSAGHLPNDQLMKGQWPPSKKHPLKGSWWKLKINLSNPIFKQPSTCCTIGFSVLEISRFFFFPLSPPKANSREPSMVASASVPRLPSQRLSSSC